MTSTILRILETARIALKWRVAAIFAGGLVFVVCSVAVAQNTWYVDNAPWSGCITQGGDSRCPFLTIGLAVRGFSFSGPFVQPGDILVVHTGVYPEPIVLSRKMQIYADGGPVTIGPTSPWPLDIVVDRVDPNGLPADPKWGAQIVSPGSLPNPEACKNSSGDIPNNTSCTHQFTDQDDKSCPGPHINWFPCTYEGAQVHWWAQSCQSCDDDYMIFIQPSNGEGYTSNDFRGEINGYGIEGEFDSDETIDHFNTPWWTSFHAAVDADGCEGCTDGIHSHSHSARDKINSGQPAEAIVTGLMGLDCAHACQCELHPVFALAWHVQPSTHDDEWVFFVRNWGDEGFCGSLQHYLFLPENKYTFALPWKSGAADVDVLETTQWNPYHNSNQIPAVKKVKGDAVYVTFNLDPPRANGSMWDGELHLQWKIEKTPPPVHLQ
jgi:hypothetical protein